MGYRRGLYGLGCLDNIYLDDIYRSSFYRGYYDGIFRGIYGYPFILCHRYRSHCRRCWPRYFLNSTYTYISKIIYAVL